MSPRANRPFHPLFPLALVGASGSLCRASAPAVRGGSMPPCTACLASKEKRGSGGCRSLSGRRSGPALLALGRGTLGLLLQLHDMQRDTGLAQLLREVHLDARPFANDRFDGLEG